MAESLESSFFFSGSENRQLYGFYQGTPNPPEAALLYIHPFGEEKNISHYVMANLLRKAAKIGFCSLRFDLSGTGDSGGELNEVSLENWREDINSALLELTQKSACQNIFVLGLRSGFNLGFWACQNHEGIVKAYMGIQPLPDTGLFMQQFIRQKISTEIAGGTSGGKGIKALRDECVETGILEVMGYPLGKNILLGMESLNEKIGGLSFQGPIRTFSMGNMEKAPMPTERWAAKIKENCPDFSHSHIVEDSFWDKYWSWKAPKTELVFLETLNIFKKDL